jgi:hypothetical protein
MAKDARTSTGEPRFTRDEDDPGLSAETTRRLRGELAEATGRDPAELGDIPLRQEAGSAGGHSAFVAQLIDARLLLGVTLIVLLIAGLVVALATGAWIVLVGLIALHAVGTAVVAAGVLQLTTETEHVSPELAARLEEEGVGDADRMFTNLVGDVTGDAERRGPAEVVAPGHDERVTSTEDDPARAGAEQRTALTPTSRAVPTSDAGPGIAGLPWYVVGTMMAFSVVVGAIEGGVAWVATAVVLIAGAGWIVLDRVVRGRLADQAAAADDRTVNRTALAVLATVVLGLVAFMSLMGIIVSAS